MNPPKSCTLALKKWLDMEVMSGIIEKQREFKKEHRKFPLLRNVKTFCLGPSFCISVDYI